ncbi:PLP-dependent aminotransferase family protein [Desulfovibrio inopinatus]|uniref:aminotransferase-like domain-containing protein n=1 Tax=Desulfovibrio inopinatus TaxID=102109 RepID=UPI000487DDBE|nr:PLP-dependent aminotransferase family protein [Desulfovibrio inopinatus]
MTIWTPHIPESGGPLYKKLADAIERAIACGELKPGERLPTHRDLADVLHMNVSTVTRGYLEAEKRSLVTGTVGRGTYVASDAVTNTSMVSFEPEMPGLLDLGLVSQLSCLDPDITEGFRRIARRKDPAAFMRYTDPRGLPEHRAAGALWASRYGLEVEAEDIIVCSGSQHGLTCCMSGLLRPGDRIATDALTYPGMKTLASMLGMRLVPIAMDEHGMIPESLDVACRRDDIKAVYLMPDVHNPTTATIPESRRDRIAHLAEVHDLLIIEDDAYALTGTGGQTPITARVRQRGVFVAGISKSFAAGLRVSFLVVPKRHLKPLAQAVLNTIWMSPALNAELVSMWILDGTADAVVKRKQAEGAQCFQVASNALKELRFQGKPNGFFIWLELPERWTGQMLERAARRAGISIFGAEKFAVGQTSPPPAARISLTGIEDFTTLHNALTTLREILRPHP